ncbi:transmembrane protein 101 isoform X1 [Scleropages formosus]|uniref:transmembrane protein 101 isoform X1 n=1 Tax=Scleropages formosus TaxID=113540 RepID=UPI000878E0CE|nr:transmembrane protein 101 isoform X1 [Scleropages formosus]XP_018591995.1 transmembrane protein 101 isoform X1 [Scleropages formosus]XP_018591996.1 transmembrane protein 101 isoform X1 [Scleropages formosus]
MMRKLFTLRKNIFRRASEDEQDMENLANSSESNSGKLEDKASTPKVRGVSFTPSHFLNVSPVVLSLLQHLNDEEWDRIEESMHSSMTRSRFTTLCTDIVGWVSEAATRIILPALALVLDVTITESSSSSPISRFEESESMKELSGEESSFDTKQDEKKSRTISSRAPLLNIVGGLASQDISTLESEDAEKLSLPFVEERSSAVSLEASFESSTLAVDLSNSLIDSQEPCQPPAKSLQESSIDSSAKISTISCPAGITDQLSSKWFHTTAVHEGDISSDFVSSEIALPLLREDVPGGTSFVSLKSDTDADSTASDIVTIVLQDLQSLSETVQSLDDFSTPILSDSATLPVSKTSIFETVRCRIRDFFSDLHPLSLSKLARRSSSKESCDEKTTTSIFNAEAETPVSGAERTASNIVDIVLHWISEDVEQISPAAPRMCKSGSDLRFDMLLSKENIQMLSPQLVGRVHRLIMEDNSALPVITLAARRVNSDSAVSKGRGGRLELAREAFSELVYIFTEKCVRKLLQECLYCLPHPPHSDNFEDVVCTTPVTSSSLVQVMPSLPFQSDISAIPSGQSPKKISTTSASSSTLIQVMPSPASQNEFSNLHVGQSTQKASKPSLELSSPSIESLITVMAQEVMKLLPEKIDDCNQVWEFLETKDICESTPLSSAVKYSGVNNTKATNHRSSSGSKVEVDPISGSEAGLKNGKKF